MWQADLQMKIGLISDIHANLPALSAVLGDMAPVDAIVCAGDIIGYNPYPQECLTRVQERASVAVQGNHDRALDPSESVRLNQMAQSGVEYARSQLTEAERYWLQQLPEQATFGNGDYLVVHSHPEHLDRYVEKSQFPELRPYLDGYEGLVLGHTHRQEMDSIDGRLVVNPGSVGQPRDGDPKAAYAVLDTETNQVDLERVSYDIDQVYHEIVVQNLPKQTGERLFEGR